MRAALNIQLSMQQKINRKNLAKRVSKKVGAEVARNQNFDGAPKNNFWLGCQFLMRKTFQNESIKCRARNFSFDGPKLSKHFLIGVAKNFKHWSASMQS